MGGEFQLICFKLQVHHKKRASKEVFLKPKFMLFPFIIKLPLAGNDAWQEGSAPKTTDLMTNKHPYLSSISRRNDAHISWVLNGNNGTGCQEELFPGPLQIDDVNTYW